MNPGRLIVPLVALVLAGIYVFNTLKLPKSAVLYPRLVAATVIVLAVYQIVKEILSGKKEGSRKRLGGNRDLVRVAGLTLLAVGFALVVEWTGFIAAAFAFVLLGALLFRLKFWPAVLLAAGATLATYLLFIKLLMLPL